MGNIGEGIQDPGAAGRQAAVLEAQAAQALSLGRQGEAAALWKQALDIDPNNARVLRNLGQLSFARGDMTSARECFERVVGADSSDPQPWVKLALVCRNLKDEQAEEKAIEGALAADPMDLLALILRADLLERQGKRHKAANVYGAITAVAPAPERLHPDLRPAVYRARAYRAKYDAQLGEYLDARLEARCRDMKGEDLRRFRDSLDILVGRKKRYESQSAFFHYHRLAPIEFFDREAMAWLDGVESATGEIREELLQLLGGGEGFSPYITLAPDVPQNQWAELNHSPRWSAFHLYLMGKRVEENALRCPRTMTALEGTPQPVLPGRAPSAMFSLLKPQTRIPPHNGVTNARVIVHLPLIVPERCGFRVGNETREWKPGVAWVFDDTIEHEAWNESTQPRTILIFDVWHPHLTIAERTMITETMAALNAFIGDSQDFAL